MYATILKIAWPYLQRYLAGKAAAYLQQQRKSSQSPVETQNIPPDDCPPCPPAGALEQDKSSANTIWYALSGILLGSAFSVIIYTLMKEPQD